MSRVSSLVMRILGLKVSHLLGMRGNKARIGLVGGFFGRFGGFQGSAYQAC